MELLVVLGEGDEAPGQDADEARNEMVWMAHEPLLAALDRVLGGLVATDVPTIAKGQESVIVAAIPLSLRDRPGLDGSLIPPRGGGAHVAAAGAASAFEDEGAEAWAAWPL